MPDVGLVDAVEDEVGEGDGVDGVVFFAPVEGFLFEGFEVVGGLDVVVVGACHVFVGLGEEAACLIPRTVPKKGSLQFRHAVAKGAASAEVVRRSRRKMPLPWATLEPTP